MNSVNQHGTTRRVQFVLECAIHFEEVGMKFKNIFGLLSIVLFAATSFALTVDRIVLVPRKPDSYVRSVSTALNTQTGQTLVVWTQRTGPGKPESVWGRLLQPDGQPEGAIFPLASGTAGAVVAYDQEKNQFVLVYVIPIQDAQGNFVTSEIRAVHLRSTGRKAGKSV